jgi:hypothetical protein
MSIPIRHWLVSESYAADIRADRRRPHPRHWEALAQHVALTIALYETRVIIE